MSTKVKATTDGRPPIDGPCFRGADSLLGYPGLDRNTGTNHVAVWREHLMCRTPVGGGHADRLRLRDRRSGARSVAHGTGHRRRPGERDDSPRPYALGPHPGLAVLRAP